MKIAKKVLAVVMAVAMIACLSAMAFAADSKYEAVATVAEDGTTVSVSLLAKDYVGLQSGEIVLKYDPAVLAFSYNDEGADAGQVGDCRGNSYSEEINGEEAGVINYGFYFREALWSAEEFAAAAKRAGTVNINSTNFELAVIEFDVIGTSAASTDITFEAEGKTASDSNSFEGKTTVTLKAEEPSTSTVVPSTAVATTVAEDPSKNPSTGDPDSTTGDNYALAAAAGVVVLAGAAFVISKKRK